MKLIIFDIDGTLIDSNAVDDACYIQAHKDVLKLESFDTNWENYSSVTDSGIADEISLKHRGYQLSDAERETLEERVVELLRRAPAEGFLPMTGAIEFLDYLKESSSYQLAIATGGWRPAACLKLDSAGVSYAEIPMATSSDAVTREGIMRIALERASARSSDTKYEKVVYFGDGLWDAKACENLGWPFIGIGRRCEQLKALGARAVFPDYSKPDSILKFI
ncbi:MAG: HAD family hydrolase [Verrucomicrobiota bacterium]